MSDCVTSRYRKARKPHRCAECRHTIHAGDTYSRVAFLWEGTASSDAICLNCDRLSEAAGEEVRRGGMNEDDGPRFGEIVPWLLDALDFPDVMARLSPEAQGHFAGLVFRMREAAAR